MKARFVRFVVLAVTVFALTLSADCHGQNPNRRSPRELPSSTFTESNGAEQPLTLEQVQEMVRAGLDDQIISRMAQERGLDRPLDVNEMLTLRRSGVSNELIRELQQVAPSSPTYSSTAPSPAAAPSAASPTSSVQVYKASPPPPVVVRTVPRYYVAPRVYVGPPHHHHHHAPRHIHPRGGTRISVGFAF